MYLSETKTAQASQQYASIQAATGPNQTPIPVLRGDADRLFSNAHGLHARLTALLDRLRIGPSTKDEAYPPLPIECTFQQVMQQASDEMARAQYAMNEIEGLL